MLAAFYFWPLFNWGAYLFVSPHPPHHFITYSFYEISLPAISSAIHLSSPTPPQMQETQGKEKKEQGCKLLFRGPR